MYEEYFGLTKNPFSIVPDPRYFYTSEGHREALAHLLYGIKSDGGFVLLTGEVGTGKTTVCRRLLEVMPEEADVAFILNPKLSAEELLATICDEFGVTYPEGNGSIKVFVARINDYLLDVHAKGRRAVLIIEEAQNLKPDVLEQIRLLTNLETKEQKLLQIIMLGQPELREILKQPQLLQLSQRITARYHLGPLSREEVPAYVDYRLSVAGLVRGQLFPPSTLKHLYRLSGGVPRVINAICDRALLGAYVQGKEQVDPKTLTKAAREVSGEEGHGRRRQRVYQAVLAALLLILFTVLGTTHYMRTATPARSMTQGVLGNANKKTPQGATLDRPAHLSGESTRGTAYSALLKEWQAQYRQGDGRDVCEQAAGLGLRCLKGRGSVAHLRQMNRPVVLKLIDDEGGDYYATLTSLKREAAAVTIGNEKRTVDVKEIARWWSGDYLLLWRAPPEYKDELRPGGRGPMVAWLDKQLALIAGRTEPAKPEQVYRAGMVKQVKRLQLATGLIPDGVVGTRTIMSLTAAVGTKEPVLQSGKESD
jgi:general secretion pathway protein A